MKHSHSGSPRRYHNNLDKWHYPKCSEIKIHFYVKNLYMGSLGEDDFLNFVKERVQKAGPCELIQITDKNTMDRTINIGIGMRYDNDAKLIYIGKKHINLASKQQNDKKITPVISEIFEILLKEKSELNKDSLEDKLRHQRFGDKRKKSSESSSESVQEDRRRKQKPFIPQINPPMIQAQRPITAQEISMESIAPSKMFIPQAYAPTLITQSIESTSIFQNATINRETLYVFGIPQEFQLAEILSDIKDRCGLLTQPDGIFKSERSGELVYEYLEVTIDPIPCTQVLKNLPIKIRNVPCLVCQKRRKTDTLQDLLRGYQIIVSPSKPTNVKNIHSKFQVFGDIMGLYELADTQDNLYYILFANEATVKQLNPPNSLDIQSDKDVIQCQFQLPDINLLNFKRPLFSETLYAQLQQQAIKPMSSSSTSSSSSSSSRSRSHSRRQQHRHRPQQGQQQQYRNNNYRHNDNPDNRRRQNNRGGRYNYNNN